MSLKNVSGKERSPLTAGSKGSARLARPFSPGQGSLNQGWIYRERVPATATGQTVLDYYSQNYRHSSRAEWLCHIQSAQILLNDQVVTADTPLRAGQQLAYHRPPWHEPNVPLEFGVLYEDESLWAIAKPSGLPVLPGGGFLHHTLLHQLQQRYPTEIPVPIHRLGRGTSGIMLVARSPQARAHLSQQLRTHAMTKIYRALIGSGSMPDEFIITHPIGKLVHPTLGYVYGATIPGKAARSECRVLQRDGHRPTITHEPTTLLAVKILTGRPHQIRIHLAVYGYPLVGDPLYSVGGGLREEATQKSGSVAIAPTHQDQVTVPGECGYWLHAHHLGFIHPLTNQWMQITCPPPQPLQRSASAS